MMKPTLKSTILATLLAGVALTAAPVLAQDAQNNDQAVMPGAPQWPDGQPPMGRASAGDDRAWPQFDLKSFDTDGDGKVSLAEIQARRAEEAKTIDANGDGKLSADELVNAEMAWEKVRIEARVKARIAALDTDGDGLLSVGEMAVPSGPQWLFQRLDTDRDGSLSAAEIAAGQQRMHARMERMGGGMHGAMKGHKHDHHGMQKGPGARGGDDAQRPQWGGAPQAN